MSILPHDQYFSDDARIERIIKDLAKKLGKPLQQIQIVHYINGGGYYIIGKSGNELVEIELRDDQLALLTPHLPVNDVDGRNLSYFTELFRKAKIKKVLA